MLLLRQLRHAHFCALFPVLLACVQMCVYPRVLLTPKDALYTAKFFVLLHQMNTPFYSTLSYVNQVVRQLTPTVLCSTRREATCLGVFLLETLTTLRRWFDSKSVFDKEVRRGLRAVHTACRLCGSFIFACICPCVCFSVCV